jgi:hypothetical protein
MIQRESNSGVQKTIDGLVMKVSVRRPPSWLRRNEVKRNVMRATGCGMVARSEAESRWTGRRINGDVEQAND